MALELKHRWVIFQHGGAHSHNSLESTLQANGSPFLAGRHQMDHPDIREWSIQLGYYRRLLKEDPEAAAQLDKPLVDRYGESFAAFPYTERPSPAPPPPGGHPHLSWCYFNRQYDDRGWERVNPPLPDAARLILEQDLGARMLCWLRHVHPELVDMVTMLQADFRQRHVSLYQRTGNQAAEGPPGETGEAIEDWLWRNVDLTYFSGCGLVAQGSRRFWRRHGHADHTTIRTLHSDVSLQDLGVVLSRAEALLARL